MLRYTVIMLSAVAIVLFVTPLVRSAATRFGVTDIPSARKVHANPVPLLGGAAIWLGFVGSLVLFDTAQFVQQFGSIIAGATLASLVGLWDDRWGMKPLFKLVGQIVAAGLMVAFGTSVQFLHNDLLNMAVTVLWVVGITNALNLMDNMDGLAGGIASWAAFFFFLLALTTGQRLLAPLALALAGACIGFLYYNFKPGHIFMGDTGSLFLGFMLAAVGIKLRFPLLYDPISGTPIDHQSVTWMVPLLVLGLPIFDTTLVTISRLRRRLPITRGGRDHVSHRLVALGATRREAVLILYLTASLLGIAAFAVTYLGLAEARLVGALVFLIACVAFWRLEQVPLVNTNPQV
ncbi:MAG TPA: MraY family glycosyltransferase [Chloroflexia bacterium]|nr:MraY family glycosyltransferase [Chloroflexia bacterium]